MDVNALDLTAIAIAAVSWWRSTSATKIAHENATALERLKSDLGRQMVADEARLRVDAEMRLRMFEHSARAIERALHNLRYEQGKVVKLASAVIGMPKAAVDGSITFGDPPTDEYIAQVFLPAELDEEYLTSTRTLDRLVVELYATLTFKSAETRARASADRAQTAMTEARGVVDTFDNAVRAWKKNAPWLALLPPAAAMPELPPSTEAK